MGFAKSPAMFISTTCADSEEEEDFQTVPLDDEHWITDPVPNRCLYIHEHSQPHSICCYSCPYMDSTPPLYQNTLDLSDISDFKDVMITSSDEDVPALEDMNELWNGLWLAYNIYIPLVFSWNLYTYWIPLPLYIPFVFKLDISELIRWHYHYTLVTYFCIEYYLLDIFIIVPLCHSIWINTKTFSTVSWRIVIISGTVHWFWLKTSFHPLLWTSSGLTGSWKLSAYIRFGSLRSVKSVKTRGNWKPKKCWKC